MLAANPLVIPTASTGCNCSVTITDSTVYPFQTNPRESYGIALFWSNDGYSTSIYCDLSNPGSTGNPGQWNVTPPSGGLWNFSMFILYVWSNNSAYQSGDIVYYQGNFYFSTIIQIAGQPAPGSSTHWMILNAPCVASYGDFISNIGIVAPAYIQWNYINTVVNCGSLSVTETSCYNYTICNTTSSVQFFSVTDLAGNIIPVTFLDTHATPVLDNSGNLLGYALTFNSSMSPIGNNCTAMVLPKEGVYVINYGTGIGCMINKKVIYEYCKYLDCYFGLGKKILCDDFDPCCDGNHPKQENHHRGLFRGGSKKDCNDCDEEKLRQHNIFRLTLNKMNALINILQMKTFYDTIHYGSIISIPPNRLTALSEIQDIINMLNRIIVRCGLCGEVIKHDTHDCGCTK